MTADGTVRELRRFPPQVSADFRRARESLAGVLSDGQLDLWAETGVELAGQSARSWEAAGRYFNASSIVARLLPFSDFAKWSERGVALCRESPALANSYYEASPRAMPLLRPRHIENWADLGLRLYKGTWKSGTLASKFFESSPALMETLTLPEIERFVAFLDALSRRSYDLASECLALGPRVFPVLGENKEAFVSLASSMLDTSWRQVKSLFEASARSLPKVDAEQRLRFLKLAERLGESGAASVPASMLDVSSSLGRLDKDKHARLLELAEALMGVLPTAMPAFIKSCPPALERVTMSQLERWFDEGMRILQQNRDGGLAYFRTESAHSQEVLEALSSTVEYGRIKGLLEMYCRALAGAELKVATSEELVEKNIGWVSNEAPSTEGSTVYVPSQVDRYASKEENFAWFKVVSTHQVAHLEFGSFRFEFDRPSTTFSDLRPRLADATAGGDDNGAERAWATDMQRFFDLFDDRALALDIFAVVEDGRLDARVKSEYRGIKKTYVGIQRDSLEQRPDIKSLPMREAVVELLVRLTLQQDGQLPAPSQYVAEAKRAAEFARRVLGAGATVEDSVEATLRIYSIISQIPNENGEDDWESVDLTEEGDYEPGGDEDLLRQLMESLGTEEESQDGQEYRPSQDVDFRGDFKPELGQLLSMLRTQNEPQSGEAAGPITQEMLEELLRNSAELELSDAQGDPQKSSSTFADNMLKDVGLDMPGTPEFGQGPLVHAEEEGGSLDATDPQTFVYDEWDFRADDYKPRWCVVRQKGMPEGDPAYYGATLHSYGSLVSQIRRQFELMVPETFRKVRKLEDGDEIDIDDVIEAMIDIRTGVGPSEKLYWRRNKVQRDVAVVFLLDTSASTAEAIDEARKAADDLDAPNDPVEYMVWLRTRRGEGMKRSYKRIIDLEKEAVVLLINALDAIGDVYGIYGFSGYGRENVEFYTIKDIDEQLSERVKSRIDRISPLHATRMGPAIRHATSKLEAQDARTKLLFLISDGRPQDRGYSREGVEKEYAVHDTKMALDEAKAKEITAFCLTVDKNGHDYLKTMCEDIGYEVLDDIYSLPRRLLHLYRTLTM